MYYKYALTKERVQTSRLHPDVCFYLLFNLVHHS